MGRVLASGYSPVQGQLRVLRSVFSRRVGSGDGLVEIPMWFNLEVAIGSRQRFTRMFIPIGEDVRRRIEEVAETFFAVPTVPRLGLNLKALEVNARFHPTTLDSRGAVLCADFVGKLAVS